MSHVFSFGLSCSDGIGGKPRKLYELHSAISKTSGVLLYHTRMVSVTIASLLLDVFDHVMFAFSYVLLARRRSERCAC